MKKVLLICVISVLLIMCTSCGNRAILDPGNFTYTHVHTSDAVSGHCWDIDKWWDNSNGIEVRTTDGAGVFLSEGTYQLFESKSACPHCND